MRGKFVVIEGGVGSGKSTLFNHLKKTFKKWNFYREPGSTPFGERIRNAVQGLYNYPVDKYAAFFGYSAARANLIRKKIIPDIKNGKNVILDRYWYSTYAYQGAEGVDKKNIIMVSKMATDNLIPDLVIHLDLDPRIGMSRKNGRKDTDRYDIKKLGFHKKIRRNYQELSRLFPIIWRIVDASKSKKEVYDTTLKVFEEFRIVSK